MVENKGKTVKMIGGENSSDNSVTVIQLT